MHNDDDEILEHYPIAYSVDNAILMHRDVHFGGDFPIMIDYYRAEGKGVSKDFDLPRIEALYEMEKLGGKNLSPLLLSGAEAEKVAESRKAYQQLRQLYDIKNPASPIPKLIADLILAENEDTQKAIDAVVAQKGAIVRALIDLVRNEEFHDPLAPGYGLAPTLAAQCLGLIGDKRAIISLFEAIGSEDFFNEDLFLDALKAIGAPAKEFLLKVLHGRPITIDNERAAIALSSFKDDPEIPRICLQMLKEIDLKKEIAFATYLVLNCENLPTEEKKELLKIANDPNTPKPLKLDIQSIVTNS